MLAQAEDSISSSGQETVISGTPKPNLGKQSTLTIVFESTRTFESYGKENLYLIGIFKYSNGNKYDGNWKMNKKDGDGTPINIYRNILL